ncbi:hypothetical protein SMD22_00800 (plasmid) [Brevibacillus halotolerans]|nr:hypothetical protein SMD22_00800 [Brevibacillus halotolerans]
MIDLQKRRLLKLIDVAKRNRHQIVVVNEYFDAYCPTIGIAFPNYEGCFDRLYRFLREKKLSPQESYDLTVDIIGTKYSWAKTYSSKDELLASSHFASWVTLNGSLLSSYHGSKGSITCGDPSLTWYQYLPLPQDVQPTACPFSKVSDEWRFIANGCQEYEKEENVEDAESMEYLSWILEQQSRNPSS